MFKRIHPMFVIASVALLVSFSAVVVADDQPAMDPNDIIFPVAGSPSDWYFSDTFGAPRPDGRTHEGIDIMSVGKVKGRPIVAAYEGYVGWVSDECCNLDIRHAGGWVTTYIHLNNDTPGTDDGCGWGIADGIESGVWVEQGQLIGWLGDSGNAEETSPHLHFEIRHSDTGDRGTAINPYEYLLSARVIEAPGLVSWNGAFWDDEDSVHEGNINRIAEFGITRGCNPPLNTRFCPDRNITRGQMAAFIRRALELPYSSNDYFSDDDGHLFEGDINAIGEAGIAFGCTETDYCPDAYLIRDEMAEFLVRAFGYPDVTTDFFSDDDENRFEDSINAIAAVDVTLGCNPPENDHFCPDRSLSRAEMASFFVRALGILGVEPPSEE